MYVKYEIKNLLSQNFKGTHSNRGDPIYFLAFFKAVPKDYVYTLCEINNTIHEI